MMAGFFISGKEMPRSLRMSAKEALERGIISKETADKIGCKHPKNKTSSRKRDLNHLVCPIEGRTPQEIIWRRVITKWPGCAIWEYENAIPGRKYRLDIAFPHIKLCIEFDGWEFHGKYKSGFKRDREKQNLLQINGWSILRFFYSEVMDDVDSIMSQIERMVSNLEQ